MSHESEDDVLASFISAEIARPEEVAGQDEMRSRLAESLGIPMPAPTPAGAPETPALGEEVAKRTLTAASRLKALVILAVGFGAGFATHAILPTRETALTTPMPSPPIPSPSTPALTSPSAASSSLPATVDPSSLPRVDATPAPSAPSAPNASVASAKSAHAPASAGDAEAERLLLETARAAMRRGDAAGALRLLRDHESRYPHGQLREERDGMVVSALGLLGRAEEAEKAAARFKKNYPMSLQGAAVPPAAHTQVDAGR